MSMHRFYSLTLPSWAWPNRQGQNSQEPGTIPLKVALRLLSWLDDLHERGELSDAEFEEQKRKWLEL
jgi:hypothetical protein